MQQNLVFADRGVEMVDDARGSVLAIAGHSADMEFTCGAVLAKCRAAGDRVVVVHCTPGEKGHRLKPPDQYLIQKTAEAQAAARVLDVEIYALAYRDNDLPVDDAVQRSLRRIMDEVQPTIIITHPPGAGHRDHRHAHLNTMGVLNRGPLGGWGWGSGTWPVRQIWFAENWEDAQEFASHVLVRVSGFYDVWLAAARQFELFRGGISPFPFEDYYTTLLRMRGASAGTDYAVSFMRGTPGLLQGPV